MKLSSFRPDWWLFSLSLLITAQPPALAEGFSVLIAPPRFELNAKPGEVIRRHLDISNPGDHIINLLVRTADWDITEQGAAAFHPPALRPNSCRPWMRIERHRVSVQPRGLKHYRFEAHVPEDAPAGECRTALLIEAPPEEAVETKAGALNLPIQGRIAVVIYLTVGDAKPQLQLRETLLDEYNGRQTPFLVVHNSGTAHGRTTGFVDAVDADGKRIEFEVTPLPILPGQTRRIPLFQPEIDGRKPQPFNPPLDLSGTLEWKEGKERFERRVE